MPVSILTLVRRQEAPIKFSCANCCCCTCELLTPLILTALLILGIVVNCARARDDVGYRGVIRAFRSGSAWELWLPLALREPALQGCGASFAAYAHTDRHSTPLAEFAAVLRRGANDCCCVAAYR